VNGNRWGTTAVGRRGEWRPRSSAQHHPLPHTPTNSSGHTNQPTMKNHDIIDEVSPSSMDEFVQVEDLNQEEEGASVLESTVAADASVPPIGKEERTTALKENVPRLNTNIQTAVTDLNAEEENVQAMLLQEVISLKEEINSLKMMMQVTCTNAAVVKEEANASCDERIDSGVDIAESDSMRRINILVAISQAQGVLAREEFFQKPSDHWNVSEFNITKYITSALEAFQRGQGIQLPTDVLHWPFQGGSKQASNLYQLFKSGETKAKCLKFQDIVVNHLHLILGSKPRLEKDAEGELMMFCE
jgi:hypothetical protein